MENHLGSFWKVSHSSSVGTRIHTGLTCALWLLSWGPATSQTGTAHAHIWCELQRSLNVTSLCASSACLHGLWVAWSLQWLFQICFPLYHNPCVHSVCTKWVPQFPSTWSMMLTSHLFTSIMYNSSSFILMPNEKAKIKLCLCLNIISDWRCIGTWSSNL
jgi:hypothetical protein